MKAQVTSFWEWQQRYSNDDTCLAELAKLRWPEGFQCPHCGHDRGCGCSLLDRFTNVHNAIANAQ
jgi:anaerobic ribonucleoside-triphosphate reductase